MINLERTNLAQLDRRLIGEPVNLMTMDLSYLAVADAIGQVERQLLAPAAELIALIKPTFELHAGALADQPQQIAAAVDAAVGALEVHGWRVRAGSHRPSADRGERSRCSCTRRPGRPGYRAGPGRSRRLPQARSRDRSR
ncbi:MAG: hypothetical protein ACR2MP_07605 [Streptosporangiaceae bacterium]